MLARIVAFIVNNLFCACDQYVTQSPDAQQVCKCPLKSIGQQCMISSRSVLLMHVYSVETVQY